ncbi:MAG: PAS domain S-box protein [Parcubacteria group bacterium]|jgi:PAS domain S-box-containing protein
MKKNGKKREQELLEKTARIYQSITRDSMDGFLAVDMRGRFLDVNDAYCHLIGHSRSELLKMNIADVEVGKKSKDVVKNLQRIKKAGEIRFVTQHRRKDGKIIFIEASANHANYANYLGGLVFIFIRDISKRKKKEDKLAKNRAKSKKIMEGQLADAYKHSEDQDKSKKKMEGRLADSYQHSKDQVKSKKKMEGRLADSYQHSKDQDKSKKKIEGQLADAYKHLGTINRKISLLLELEYFPKSKKHDQKIIDHVLNLAMNISNAQTGYLYGSKGRGRFDLLSCKGCEEEQKEKIKVITSRKVELLKHLLKEKNLISGNIKQHRVELLALNDKLEYFVTLPLSKETALGGFIFLGFDKKKSVDAQDLEFLDVFAIHASNALAKAGVLK